MDKVAIFYHIYEVNHWSKLFEQQIISLQHSGVYDAANYIHFGVNGDNPLPYNLIKVNKVKFNAKKDSESDTLADLHRFCVENSDYKVLYLHTKGVTYPENDECQTNWLTYLDYFNIKHWKDCVKLLDTYDCVGTDWTIEHPDQRISVPPHYSGNFWWANASYIKTLDPSYLYNDRHSSEFWIGTGIPNFYNYYSSNKNKYRNPIQTSEYQNLPIDDKKENLLLHTRTIYPKHWEMLGTMLNDAYGRTEKPDTHVMLATYVHLAAEEYKKRVNGGKVIVYQTEPLVKNHWWSVDHIVDKIKGADEVWDYDLENIAILKSRGIEAKFRPPVYTERLKRVKNVEEPDIDILFYGVLTNYRAKFLYDIVENVNFDFNMTPEFEEKYLNLNTVTIWNVHDKKLDEFIGRSKIILNLNPYEGECRQQQTRIFYNLINNKCVLSEKNRINYYGDQIVEFSGVDDLASKAIDLLVGDKWRLYTKNDFKSYSKKMIEGGADFYAAQLNSGEIL